MRIARVLCGALLLLGLSVEASAVGLAVEQLEDTSVIYCPVCRRPIVPGSIHDNAVDIIATEMGGALEERGLDYTEEPGEARALNVLIYRFQERRGGNFSVERPASVGFHVHLIEEGRVVGIFVFDETQQPLSENVFRFFTFLRRGLKWITAEELAREGVDKAVDFFLKDLEPPPAPAREGRQ
jgi:hypothetical protein